MPEYQILHVDDEKTVRELLKTYLEETVERADFSVTTAGDTTEAASIIESKSIDCLITDYQMPDKDGIEFISDLRLKHPNIPLILMTNKGSAEIASKAIEAGATDYVRKGRGREQYEVLANRIINAVEQERGRVAQDRLTQTSSIITDIYEEINNSEGQSFKDRLETVLKLGREKLGYPIGYVAQQHENSIEITSVVGNHDTIKQDSTHPIENTFCKEAIDDAKPVIIDDISNSQRWKKSAAADETGFSSYSGAPIISNGELYGTVCFGDYSPNDVHTQHHKIVVNAISQWMGYEVERNEYESELKRQIDRLEEFTGVVSHDLRSPLNVAKGRAEIIERNQGSDNAEAVRSSLERMEGIIEDTLTLARQGKTVDETERVDIENIVDRSRQMIDTGESEIRLINKFSLCCDKNRMLHVFENLFRNAIEHSEDPVTIRVGKKQRMLTSTRATPDEKFTFYIEDDGPGIPEDKRDEVFNAGESSNNQGTGFGLTIVKRIAEAHGWSISVTESHDGGARFEFKEVEC